MADVYIDPDWTGAGVAGTKADPFKTADDSGVNARTGDQSGDTVYLKRGTTLTGEGFGVANAMTNINFDAYGDASLTNPIIDVNYVVFYGIALTGTDVSVSHITIKRADKYGLYILTGTDNVTIDDVITGDSLLAGESAANACQISGTSAGTKLTNLVVSNCTFRHTSNNCIEMSHLDGALITDCLAHDAAANGYEVWDSTTDVTFIRCKVHTVLNGFKAFLQSAETHPNVTIRNCEGWNIGQVAIDNESGNGWVIENNTMHSDSTTPIITIDAGNTGHTHMGNIYYCAGALSGNEIASFGTGVTFTGGCDNNVYHTHLAPPRWRWDGTVATNITNYKTAANPSEANSLETDPLFTDLANFDLSLSAVSPGLYETLDSGTTATVTSDINKQLRYGGEDVGAYQFQRHPDIKVSLKV